MTRANPPSTRVMDGAMGTRLVEQGLDLRGDDPCFWNLTHPDTVRRIHKSYVDAGAEILLTNTFGANRPNLGPELDDALLNRVLRAGVSLARAAVRSKALVFGSIGPIRATVSQEAEYRLVFEFMAEARVDGILLETHDPREAIIALKIAAEHPVHSVHVCFSPRTNPDSETIREIERLGAQSIGFNCMIGIDAVIERAQRLRRLTRLPLIMRPSAGLPDAPLETAVYWADRLPAVLATRVALLGGCCGTDATHIAAIHHASRNV